MLRNLLWLALSLVFASIYYYYVFFFSDNIPYYDDFTVLGTFNEAFEANNLSEWLKMLFSQHNEHRIFTTRIAALATMSLGHGVDFYWLAVMGNIGLIGIWFWFYLNIRDTPSPALPLMLGVSVFVFSIHMSELTTWAMASFQNIWVHTFAVFALYFLNSRNPAHVFVSLAFVALCVFSSGNGFLVVPAGIILLFLRGTTLPRFMLWSVSAALLAGTYFIGFYKIASHPTFFDTGNVKELVMYFFTLVGSVFAWDETARLVAGIVLCVLVLGLFLTRRWRDHPIVVSYLAFLFATAGIVSISRCGFGVAQAMSSRYAILSALISACLIYLYYTDIKLAYSYSFSARWKLIPILIFVAGTLAYIRTFESDTNYLAHKHQVISRPFIWDYYNNYITDYVSVFPVGHEDVASKRVSKALQLGTWQLPTPAQLPGHAAISLVNNNKLEIALSKLQVSDKRVQILKMPTENGFRLVFINYQEVMPDFVINERYAQKPFLAITSMYEPYRECKIPPQYLKEGDRIYVYSADDVGNIISYPNIEWVKN